MCFVDAAKGRLGFTLIELSIVLVILGLIVGGIVGGKSLISAAETQKLVREMKNFTTMVNAFELQYDAKPGDFKDATSYWSGTGNGDGDSYIEQDPDEATSENETVYAWQHLNLSEIYINTHTTVGLPMQLGKNVYPSVFKGAGWMFESWSYASLSFSSYVWLGKEDGTWIDDPAISPREASKIDKKIDDGQASSGRLLAVEYNVVGECLTGTPGDYQIGSAAIGCNLLYRF